MRAAAFAGCERGERRALQRLHAAARKCQRRRGVRAPAATLDAPRDEHRRGGALQCGTTRDVKQRPVRWPGNLRWRADVTPLPSRMINDPALAVAVRAARRGGAIVVDAARDLRRLASHARGQRDIAAAAQSEAGKAIADTLRAAFPTHAVLGREAGETVPPAPDGYLWVVDPIDGMTNFVHGFPYFAVSIALAHGQDITHAVVHDPVHDELFAAILGKGAQLNGAPIRVSACTALERGLVATVFPGPTSTVMPAYVAVLNSMITRCAGLRRAGACSLDLAHLAAGRLDGFWVMSREARDVAAGALIVREAGGRVGDFAGGSEYLRTNEVIAAAPGMFNPLREAIAAALPSR